MAKAIIEFSDSDRNGVIDISGRYFRDDGTPGFQAGCTAHEVAALAIEAVLSSQQAKILEEVFEADTQPE